MKHVETIIGATLASILLFVAMFFGWRQRRGSVLLRHDRDMPDDERRYLTRQIRRRVVCSVLLAIFAGFLFGWLYLEPRLPAAPAEGEAITQVAKDELRFLTYYWITALFVLLVILVLASWDLLATARYGFQRHQQLEQDRRAMLEMEAANLRRRRQELN